MSDNKHDDDQYQDDGYIDESAYEDPYADDASQDHQDEETTYPQDESNEWADDIDDDSASVADTENDAQKKKKSSLIKIAAIVGVVILGGVVLSMLKGSGGNQLPTDNSNVPMTPANGETAIAPAPDAATTTATNPLLALHDISGESSQQPPVAVLDPVAPSKQGLMDNPALLKKMDNPLAEPQPVEPTAIASPSTTTETDAPPIGENENKTMVAKPLDNMSSIQAPIDGLTEATPSPSQAVAELATAIASPIAPTVNPVSDFPTVDSIKKVEQPKDKATEPTNTPTKVSEPVLEKQEPLGVPSVAPEKNEQDKALQEKFEAAQKKIAELETRLANKEKELTENKTPAVTAPTQEPEAIPERKTVSAERNISEYQQKASRTEEKPKTKRVATKTVASKKVLPSKWVLKSIRSGAGTLENKATGDYRTVHVGESLPELGRITFIGKESSGWIIRGAKGSIKE